MSHEYYSIYRKETVALVRSFIIKFSEVATIINLGITEQGYTVDESRPETWKYYLNLAGKYHPSDQMIKIRSLDTLETIEFTRENLQTHLATAKAYRWGTDEYRQLLRLYRNQVDLINGIISPVPFEKAYAAKDGEILGYAKELIEPQEEGLVRDIQQWINTYLVRWHNPKYTIIAEYYLVAMLGHLYSQLNTTIATLRLRNCKTNRAHSFHIREYLASHGRIDRFFPYLSLEQQLWLYRNINDIYRNTGKRETFDQLVKHLLTARNIPLSTYLIKHDYSQLPDNIYPGLKLTKEAVNNENTQTGRDDITISQLLTKEQSLARDNARVQPDYESSIPERVKNAQHSELATRIYESEADDRSGAGVRLLHEMLGTHWLYLATHDRYRAFVRVHNPSSGEQMILGVKDAYILMTYCLLAAQGEKPTYVPEVNALEAYSIDQLSEAELWKLVETKYIKPKDMQRLRTRFTPFGEYVSTEAFYNAVSEKRDEYINAWDLCTSYTHLHQHRYMDVLRKVHYKHVRCKLTDVKTTYQQWFQSSGFSLTELTADDYVTLATDLFANATGANLHRQITFTDIQRYLLKLVNELSSYSVQFLGTTSYSDFLYLGYPMPRLGDYAVLNSIQRTGLHPPMVNYQQGRSASKMKVRYQKLPTVPRPKLATHVASELRANVGVSVDHTHKTVMRLTLSASRVDLMGARIYSETNPPPSGETLPWYRYSKEQRPVVTPDYNLENGPGPHKLLVGDMSRGYFGTLSDRELFDGAGLSSQLGMDEGVLGTQQITWFKFAYQGEVIFIPSCSLRYGVTHKRLASEGLIDNTANDHRRTVSTHGSTFTVRLPGVYPEHSALYKVNHQADGTVQTTIDHHLISENGIVHGEWADLMLSIVRDLKDSQLDPFSQDMIVNQITLKDIGISLSQNEFFLSRQILEYQSVYPDAFGKPAIQFNAYGLGGYGTNPDLNGKGFTRIVSDSQYEQTKSQYGWRPVLVLIR